MAIAKNIAKRGKPRKHVPWRPRPNVAKRARALAIMKRKRIKPLTKAEARALIATFDGRYVRIEEPTADLTGKQVIPIEWADE